MNFYQFYDKLNGIPYESDDESSPSQSPPKFQYMDYLKAISNGNSFSGVESGSNYELKPLDVEDMARASDEDVMNFMKQRGNTTRLGEPLDDEGMKKYTGMQ